MLSQKQYIDFINNFTKVTMGKVIRHGSYRCFTEVCIVSTKTTLTSHFLWAWKLFCSSKYFFLLLFFLLLLWPSLQHPKARLPSEPEKVLFSCMAVVAFQKQLPRYCLSAFSMKNSLEFTRKEAYSSHLDGVAP